jgi:hypothetical protein
MPGVALSSSGNHNHEDSAVARKERWLNSNAEPDQKGKGTLRVASECLFNNTDPNYF